MRFILLQFQRSRWPGVRPGDPRLPRQVSGAIVTLLSRPRRSADRTERPRDASQGPLVEGLVSGFPDCVILVERTAAHAHRTKQAARSRAAEIRRPGQAPKRTRSRRVTRRLLSDRRHGCVASNRGVSASRRIDRCQQGAIHARGRLGRSILINDEHAHRDAAPGCLRDRGPDDLFGAGQCDGRLLNDAPIRPMRGT
jgi:hypothetical protein